MAKQDKSNFESLLKKVQMRSEGKQIPIQKVVPVKQEKNIEKTTQINADKKSNENFIAVRMTFRVDESIYKEFQHLATEMYFKYNFLSDKQTFQYILYNTVQNMKNDFEQKYGKIEIASETYKAFYEKKQTKGTPLPHGIVMKNPKIVGIMSDEQTKELYSKLMHNFYIHELKNSDVQRYSASLFFYEIVKYLRENIDEMNIYQYKNK